MDFNTQVCTTLEQSKRLLALGLKKETADMFYDLDDHYGLTAYVLYADLVNGWDDDYVPAWSLHRLLEMMPNTIVDSRVYLFVLRKRAISYERDMGSDVLIWSNTGKLYYDAIRIIEQLIGSGDFNKEYLEETK